MHPTPDQVNSFAQELSLSIEDVGAIKNFICTGQYQLNQQMVGPKEFFLSPNYLGAEDVLYPVVLESLIELNSGKYEECLLLGAIGVAKSTIALYSMAYILYQLSCYKAPQKAFGLDPASEIIIVFQSVTASLSKAVDFNRFKALIERSNYFKNYFMFDKNLESELRFPNNIIAKPVSGEETSVLGQNVISGVLDEVNFMQVTHKSQKSIDGGTYDQATALYNSISRRRKSRFQNQGKLPGMVCIVSSRRYPGQFTDTKEAEVRKQIKENGISNIYVYDKRVWDIKPDSFCGETFKVFAGDATRQPRILGSNDKSKSSELVIDIPVEFKDEFERDILNALRDIAGVSTLARHPFLMNVEAVATCLGTHKSIMSGTTVDFADSHLKARPKLFTSPDSPRWCHIDLAITGDSAGLVIGYVPCFKKVKRGGEIEELPVVKIDCTLEIVPPKGGEIVFSRIRQVLYKLRELGLNIRWVSFDSFQSRDSLQILHQKGFIVGQQSMDRTNTPYEMLKMALYDGRVQIPEHPKLFTELRSLEKDTKTGKIDHPNHGSKDLSDALAGVVYGLTMRRETWVRFGIQTIPISVKNILVPTPLSDNL